MPTFSQRNGARHYCQSWKDLTTEEIAEFAADKYRAVCHLNKGHVGDHEDKILELCWGTSGWPKAQLYPAAMR